VWVQGHAVLISGLLKAGANKELKNKDGMTAWELAEQRKHTEALRALAAPYQGTADLTQVRSPPSPSVSAAVLRKVRGCSICKEVLSINQASCPLFILRPLGFYQSGSRT
jgi:ankyrin repeat protein